MFGAKSSLNWEWEIDNNTFDLVDVSQFKNTRFSTILALILAVVQILLSIALFISDCYTCVRLLAYNSWAGAIKPAIPFTISRWIFSGCILLSVVLLIYEWIVGIRVYHTRNISLTYTNDIARLLWSLRGYSYFCVYDQITPKTFFDYCAFFVYFSFKTCLKLLLAESPRQVINGYTIYSVARSDPEKILASFQNILKNGVTDTWAIVFIAMSLSFIIWLIFIVKFALALLTSLCVVSTIHNERQNLKQFVCLKINDKVRDLVSKYHKESLKAVKEENSKLGLQPTLPVFDDDDNDHGRTGLNRSFSQKLENTFRRSLRRSGNDLLPLNKHAAPPLPQLNMHKEISEKPSMSSMGYNAPEERFSPVYGNQNNTGGFYRPHNTGTSSFAPNNTGELFRRNNPNPFSTPPSNSGRSTPFDHGDLGQPNPFATPNSRTPYGSNVLPQYTRGPNSDYQDSSAYAFSSSQDDLLGKKPLVGTFAGSTYSGLTHDLSTPYNDSMIHEAYTGSTKVDRQFSRLNTGLSQEQTGYFGVQQTEYVGHQQLRMNQQQSGFSSRQRTGGQNTQHTGASNQQQQFSQNSGYQQRQMNTGQLSQQGSAYVGKQNSGGSSFHTPALQPEHTASGFGNSMSPPYPSESQRAFVSPNDNVYSMPRAKLPYPNNDNNNSFNSGLPSIVEHNTGSTMGGPGNVLPYSSAKATGQPSGTVNPNSRLLLINNLFGEDNPGSNPSPVLDTYTDMGLDRSSNRQDLRSNRTGKQ